MRHPAHYALFGFCLVLSVCQAALLGIDFGQQFTKACLLAPGVPFEMVLTADSKRKDLSGLTFKDAPGSGGLERYYGNSAANLMTRFPTQSPFFFKPLLGKTLDPKATTVQDYKSQIPGMSLVPSSNNRSTISFSILDDLYPLEEILGMNIRDISNRAKSMLSGNGDYSRLKGAVLTVPPFFNVHQRQALEDAVELSGLSLISLIDSGSAVATNFASTRQFTANSSYFLVYDMGAGSTTATLVSIKEENSAIIVDVEGVAFDQDLGGQYYTKVIKEKLVDMLLSQNSAIKKNLLLKDSRAMSKLWKEAERAKAILSANSEVTCRIESVYEDIDFRGHLTRSDFENELKKDTLRIKQPVLDALERDLVSKKPLPWKDLEGIIFMGGSTRVPLVQKAIQDSFPDKLMKFVNTDEAGVLGATFRGVTMSNMFKSKNITVIDRALWDYNATFSFNPSISMPLFPSGTPLGSFKSISYQIANLEDFHLIVSENGQGFAKFDISQTEKVLKDLKLNQYKYGSSLSVNATFQLTTSRLVRLVSVWTEVRPENITEGNEELASTSETETSSTTIEKAQAETTLPIIKRTLSSKVKHLGPRPMGTVSKEYSKSRISELEKLDRDREMKETIRNELEATLYRIKEIAVSDEDEDSKINLEQGGLLDTVNESLDWLDFEGLHASTKELKQKLAEARKLLAAHGPRVKANVFEHGVALKNFTERIASVKERIMKHPEEDNLSLEQVVMDAASQNIDVAPAKTQMLKLLQNEISEQKKLEKLLEDSVKLSGTIINSLSNDGHNIEEYLSSLEELVQQNEKLESQLNEKRKERLEEFKASVMKGKPNVQVKKEQDEL